MANSNGWSHIELVGKKIVDVRPMTPEELTLEGWTQIHCAIPMALVLENGVTLYPSQDVEGNAPGCFFGKDENGQFRI